MAKWLIDKTKFYIPCPECNYAFGEMYENYIKGSANRKHYFFKCRKCNCFIETRKKSKLMDVYFNKYNSVKITGLDNAIEHWKKVHTEAENNIELLTSLDEAIKALNPSSYIGEKGY